MLTDDRRVLDVPLEERLRLRISEMLACVKTILPRHQSKRSRRRSPITHRSSRHPHLFLRSNHGRSHDHHTYPRDSNESSSYQSSPRRYSAALSERTNEDGHAFLRHPPVLSWCRQRHLNPSDSKQHACTRLDKSQHRSRVHTWRRSGTNFPCIGIDATGLKIKLYYY
jgi:hypothetical protein